MNENLHDIDKLFKDGIEGQQEVPSRKVWDAIDNNLDKAKIIQIKRRYNNFKRLAIALLLLLSATVIYEIKTKDSLKEELASSTNDNGNTKNNIANTTNNAANTTSKNLDKNNLNTADAVQQNTGKNKEVNNAGGDNLNGSTKNTQTTPSTSTPTHALQNNVAAVKNTTANTIDNDEEALVSKSTTKKSSAQKTRIKIKNGTATEDAVNGDEETASGKNMMLSFSHKLTGLQKNSAEKINTVTAKNELTNVTLKKISPDAVVTTTKNKAVKNKRPFHFNVLPFYAPQFAFNHIEDDNQNTTPAPPSRPGGPPANWREEIRKQEQHQTASTFGILVELPLNKRWSIQSGVTYLHKKIDIEPKKIYAILDNDGKVRYRFDCSSGYTYLTDKTGTSPTVGDSISTIASSNTLGYIGIPLAINYTINAGKLTIKPAVGAVINLLTKQKIEAELVKSGVKETQTFDHIHGLKPNYFTATAGVALDYNISKRLSLNVTPSASFALSSITKNAIVRSYPNSFGVAAGVRIKF